MPTARGSGPALTRTYTSPKTAPTMEPSRCALTASCLSVLLTGPSAQSNRLRYSSLYSVELTIWQDAPRYRSPLRRERAEETRRRIAAAALELFAAHGFSGTTVAGIAERAGVSAPTVYATFGSKGAIVRALLEQMEDNADVGEWGERIDSEPDPQRKLAAFAQWSRVLFSSSKAVIAAADGAVSDPAIVELRDEGNRHRREGLRDLISSLAEAGALERRTDRARGARPRLDAHRGGALPQRNERMRLVRRRVRALAGGAAPRPAARAPSGVAPQSPPSTVNGRTRFSTGEGIHGRH